ncbi:MAG: zinc-ribbon domain-containing protein [Myxococcaceae bacterium]|nr:zinc-ribbon domain-containing protein [Myxococcaceae bacterium]MCI0671912.1 zinc-ribbon domain-containing protein [Myxococcaceae bacterium]
MGFRFFAVPGHQVVEFPQVLSLEGALEPELPAELDDVERALVGVEFRDTRARDRLRALLLSDRAPTLGSPGPGFGPSAIFARPPQDLPALLRMADQLEQVAQREAGERALVWRCGYCSTRYAVPMGLVRAVSIRCEKCGNPIELSVSTALGEESLLEPAHGAVNAARHRLAVFFREAMARGWLVMVTASEGMKRMVV